MRDRQAPLRGGSSPRSERPAQNVGETERWISLIGGGALALYGLTRLSARGLLIAGLGGALASRGLTGHCSVYQALGVDTADGSRQKVRTSQAVKVEQRITVNRSPDEVYRFWRNFKNLPRFMQHLESVSVHDDTHSRWVVKAPLGTTVTWEAEIINEKENELIGWRSVGGSDVDNAGSVRFTPMPGGGTEVRVTLQYDPPGGLAGTVMARIMGDAPEKKIAEDLQRFKEVMEAGETAAIEK
ncbi:MAG TPA: SRPBCC family protein [Nitrospiraceae bacterium]|nr:SRPBCC family protein [Nitrospiraceae bacterium]